jgi:signal transduction histidine kinase
MSVRGALDLRGLGRWSKTAAIVVLVVFALVVGVSIAGLYAFAKGRDADVAQRRAEIRDLTKARLDDLRREIRESLTLRVRDVEAVRDADSYRRFLEQPGGDLVAELHVVDRGEGRRGEVRWVDRTTLLALPRDTIESWADAQAQELGAAQAAAQTAKKVSDPREALAAWCALLEDYPLVAYPIEGYGTWPLSLTWVGELLGAAQALPIEQPGDAERVARAVRAALSVTRLSAGLRDVRPEDLATHRRDADTRIRQLLDSPAFAGASDLRWEVAHMRRAASALDDPASGGALDRAAEAARQLLGPSPAVGSVLLQYAPPSIVALVVLPPPAAGGDAPLAALRLDPARLERWIRERADDPRMARLGVEVRVAGPGGAPDGQAESDAPLLAEASLVDLEGAWNPPFRLRAHRVRDPDIAGGVRGAWSHWLVLGLAAVGILIGGWVLVRLLTREMRLARLKADFVGNLSHELKTPITSIALFTEMLQDGKLVSEDDRAEAYGVLQAESARLGRTVERMLDIVRREAGGSPYAMAVDDLRVPVRCAAERFLRIVPDAGLDLEARLPGEALWARHDREAIEDVVTNLLSNAWKYRRGEAARIRLRLERLGPRARLTCSDDGIGIPRAERRRVFQTFYRAEQYLTQDVAGTGLGLALVRSTVRAHGGRVRVRGGPAGTGTTFEVLLPLTRAPGPGDPEVTADGTVAHEPPSEGETTVQEGSTASGPARTLDPR